MKSECLNFLKSKHLYHLECFFLHNQAAPFPASSASAMTDWRARTPHVSSDRLEIWWNFLQRHLLEDHQEALDGGLLRCALQHDAAQLPPIGLVTNYSPTQPVHEHSSHHPCFFRSATFYPWCLFEFRLTQSIDPCRLAGLGMLKQVHLVYIPLVFLQHGSGCKQNQ